MLVTLKYNHIHAAAGCANAFNTDNLISCRRRSTDITAIAIIPEVEKCVHANGALAAILLGSAHGPYLSKGSISPSATIAAIKHAGTIIIISGAVNQPAAFK